MAGQRLYGLPAGLTATTNSNGLVAVTWPAFTAVPNVQVAVENSSTTLGAFADVLAGSVTTTGCTVRAWRITSTGSSPALPYAGAKIHVMPWGTVA